MEARQGKAQGAQFWKLENILGCSPVLAGEYIRSRDVLRPIVRERKYSMDCNKVYPFNKPRVSGRKKTNSILWNTPFWIQSFVGANGQNYNFKLRPKMAVCPLRGLDLPTIQKELIINKMEEMSSCGRQPHDDVNPIFREPVIGNLCSNWYFFFRNFLDLRLHGSQYGIRNFDNYFMRVKRWEIFKSLAPATRITSELTNQSARKALFTCVVYTN